MLQDAGGPDPRSRRKGSLVGREAELRVFGQALARLANGASQVIEVTGDPGIGKTRLLAELARLAAGHGLPVLGGRAYEDFGEGDGLLWYSVIGVQAERELILAGHLLPPFGGPAVTALRLSLSAKGKGTLLQVQDHRFGVVGDESPVDGWRLVFDAGLRRFIESGEKTP